MLQPLQRPGRGAWLWFRIVAFALVLAPTATSGWQRGAFGSLQFITTPSALGYSFAFPSSASTNVTFPCTPGSLGNSTGTSTSSGEDATLGQ